GGLWNRHLLTFDSVVSHIDTTIHYRYVTDTERLTDYRRSILEQDFHAQRGRFTQLLKEGGKYRFYQGRIGQGGTALQEREAAPGPDTREMPGEVLTDDLTPVVKVDPQVPRQRTPDDVDITDYRFTDEADGPLAKEERKPADRPVTGGSAVADGPTVVAAGVPGAATADST
ncbi:MAG: hypothetical protein KDB77_15735, partial [Flavobacteriales bacterium]|nr:hypothetical protein [Flavobacteriales bacterium]